MAEESAMALSSVKPALWPSVAQNANNHVSNDECSAVFEEKTRKRAGALSAPAS